MQHPRSIIALLLTITLLLFAVLGFLLFRSNEGNTPPERVDTRIYESAFAPSTSPDTGTTPPVSQDNTEDTTSFGSDIDMEFPVLDE